MPDLLYVKVVDQQSNPVSNINLVWSTTNGSVTGSALTQTDGQGNATWTLGSTEGTQTVKVEAKDKDGKLIKGSPIEFTAIAKGDSIILTTDNITSITSTSAVSGGNITNDGGSPITARGVCWSTLQNPTIADNKTSDGTGTGSFTSNITGLTPSITYYVRAYATNSIGTNYGNDVSFTTLQASSPKPNFSGGYFISRIGSSDSTQVDGPYSIYMSFLYTGSVASGIMSVRNGRSYQISGTFSSPNFNLTSHYFEESGLVLYSSEYTWEFSGTLINNLYSGTFKLTTRGITPNVTEPFIQYGTFELANF